MYKTLSLIFIFNFFLPVFASGNPEADSYLENGNKEKAIEKYKEALKEGIKKKEAYPILISIGGIYLSKKQYASAIEYYQEAANLLPKLDKAHLCLANVYEQSELNELSSQEYLYVLKRNKKCFEANYNLGLLYLKQGLNTQAMEYFMSALVIKSNPEVYRSIAACAKNTGDIGLALKMLNQVNIEERTYDDNINLGLLYNIQKNYNKAEESFSQAVKLNFDKIDGYAYLGLLFIDTNRLEEAEKLFDIAQKKSLEDGLLHFFAAYIYYKQNKIKKAEAEINLAVKFSKTEILKHYSAKFLTMLKELKKHSY